MLTFDNDGNILVFSEKKDGKKKGFFKKHWKKLLAGAAGAAALGVGGALAYKNRHKIGEAFQNLKDASRLGKGLRQVEDAAESYRSANITNKETERVLDNKIDKVKGTMELLKEYGGTDSEGYKNLQKELQGLTAARKEDLGGMGYNEHDADYYIHGGR